MFESVVRPAQNPDVLPRRRIVSSQTVVDVVPGAITWGQSGQLPSPVEVPVGELPMRWNFKIQKSKEYKSTKMDTETIRVENPDDSDQYVMLQRIKKINFKDKKPDKLAAYPDNPNTQARNGPDVEFVPWTSDAPREDQLKTEFIYPLEITDGTYIIEWAPGG